MRLCVIDDCGARHYSLGYCIRHYLRWKKHGSTADPRPTLSERLAQYEEDENGCWIWWGKPDAGGYGRLSINHRDAYAHRASYEHHVGPIPDGLTIDHLCRNRKCINPAHLEPVTLSENSRRANVARKASA